MKARDVMVCDVPSINKKTPIEEAVRMLHRNFGDESFLNAAPGLIVIDDRGNLAGVFTPLTVISALLEHGRTAAAPGELPDDYLSSLCNNIRTMPVSAIMEHQAISVTEEADIADVAALFAKHRFQRIPVVSGKRVTGIIYRSRLLFAMAKTLL